MRTTGQGLAVAAHRPRAASYASVAMPRRLPLLAVLLIGSALLLASCGGGDDDGRPMDASPPPATKADFPKPAGRTLAELRGELGPGPALAPSVSVLQRGKESRFGFALFDRSRKQISNAKVALYVADANGRDVRGPFPARFESLEVKPEFQSESVTADPDAAKSIYVAELPFERAGEYQLMGVAEFDGRLVSGDPIAVRVVEESPVPEVGEPAPRIHTPTVEDVGGAIERIDTRVPPAPDLHEVDFADALGSKPIVLVFATPALCQSRVCGPVVDIMRQVKAQYEDEAAWIHMEIFEDNELDKGFREQVRAFNLPTEPWAFTIDASGRVAARLEGAWSARELERAVQAAVNPR